MSPSTRTASGISWARTLSASMIVRPMVVGGRRWRHSGNSVRAGGFQLFEEYVVELEVVILAGVHEYMVQVLIQSRNYPRQPYYFGPRTYYCDDFQETSTSDLLGDRVRSTFAVEDFIGPKEGHQGVVTHIGDIVRPARRGLDDHRRLARCVRSSCVSPVRMWRKRNKACVTDDQELLGLGVMIVAAARDARNGCEVGKLAGGSRLEDLGEQSRAGRRGRSAGRLNSRRRQIGDVGCIEGANQAHADRVDPGFAAFGPEMLN